MNYSDLDGIALAELVRNRKVSPGELLEAAVSRAEKAQARVNCFAALYPDLAREQISKGGLDGPYAGVPFATKDLAVGVKGAPLTGGSVAYKGTIAAEDATLTKRFRAAGLVFFGSTTTPEYGLTLTTESTLYGQTRNPWDRTRIAGGSSGGAAAAVAAGDRSASRRPAAACSA